MKELRLEDVFRYGLSGGIGIAVLLLTYSKLGGSVSHLEGAREVTLILGSVLMVGTLIYNVHRALTYPVFFWLLAGLFFTKKFGFPWTPSPFELDLDSWRSGLCDTQRHRWDEWGAQTHFLYCAAWAILAALILGCFLWGPPDRRAWYIFWTLFVVTLVAALFTNYRLLCSITHAKGADDKKIPTC